ncbi:MAG: ferrous iron transport protein B [Clostridia bacterium]|nr:ferrous iron transport protein B [Clostridia bacterium]
MTLNELAIGKTAVVKEVGGSGALRQHMLDMGVIPGAELKIVKYAPMGDPMELIIHGYELTLRVADAAGITVEETADQNGGAETPAGRNTKEGRKRAAEGEDPAGNLHPGLGEGGKFHPKGSGAPLPEGTELTFALVGNQNCGKTTLFNQLTGSNRHVGNFPGVTVDRKDGAIRGYSNATVTDLPGIYSMSPYSGEEIVSRSFVLDEKPKGIINIVDATNIERNLYLTMQLLEMEVPMVVALNMMDEVLSNGGSVDINTLEKSLGVPVVAISAAKNQGVNELIDHAVHVARFRERPVAQDLCGEEDNGGAVHRCIHSVEHLIEDHARDAGLPLRFAACKLIEGDELIAKQLKLDRNERETVEHITVQMENERGLDRAAAIADMRFAFINKVCKKTVIKPRETRERKRSEKIDRVLTGKYTAVPTFIVIMALVFFLTFNVIGGFLQSLVEKGVDALSGVVDGWLTSAGVNAILHSLVINGIFKGVGSVISFLPIIVTLFFFLSMLEDSGDIARVAFVMDKLLRKIGLSGRSIVPMLIGFGCTVPAVMATRTLPSERDRKMTVLLTPFMSCSAKVPIYAFFAAAFFPGHSALVMTALYLLGIVVGILAALLYKNTLFKGEAVPFVMELPNYRLPSARSVLRLMWEKAKDFLQRAFSVILIASLVIWFLQSFDIRFNLVTDSSTSLLASASGWLAYVMKPVGLGDWRICTSLISGFVAKESVVSSLEMLFPDGIAGAFGTLSAICLLVFSLLYTPCVASIASIRREMGRKWALGVVMWQCFVAYGVTALVHLFGMLFGGNA